MFNHERPVKMPETPMRNKVVTLTDRTNGKYDACKKMHLCGMREAYGSLYNTNVNCSCGPCKT